jgi:outer membrane receptor protein involved in Fe transport
VNKAFQTPNYSEFFLQVPVAAPSTGPGTLQGTIQGYYQQIAASPLAGTLAGLTTTLPWNFVGAQGIIPTPALALGNANLKVEKVTGWELGYKGSLSQNAYITVDGYINQLKDFVTDLLPAVNQTQYPTYALDSEVNLPAELATLDGRLAGAGLPANHPLRAAIPQLLAGYGAVQAGTRIGGANALATLPDGSRAIVLSYTNAGKVTERGVEVGLGYQLTPEFRGDVTFTGFDFTVKSQAVGDQLVPNTPSKKASASLSYAGQQGVDANVTVRLVDGYQWAAGVFQGYVPSNEFVNVSAGYRVNNYFRIHATATNLFDEKRFQLYGGSVIGRRVLGGITAAF